MTAPLPLADSRTTGGCVGVPTEHPPASGAAGLRLAGLREGDPSGSFDALQRGHATRSAGVPEGGPGGAGEGLHARPDQGHPNQTSAASEDAPATLQVLPCQWKRMGPETTNAPAGAEAFEVVALPEGSTTRCPISVSPLEPPAAPPRGREGGAAARRGFSSLPTHHGQARPSRYTLDRTAAYTRAMTTLHPKRSEKQAHCPRLRMRPHTPNVEQVLLVMCGRILVLVMGLWIWGVQGGHGAGLWLVQSIFVTEWFGG